MSKTQKNIFIEELGNRPQAMGLPNHYSKLGHNVYMLKPNEFLCDWNWEKIPIWHRLLHKEGIGSNTRNLSNFSNIVQDNNLFNDICVEPKLMKAAWNKNIEVREYQDWNDIDGAVSTKILK